MRALMSGPGMELLQDLIPLERLPPRPGAPSGPSDLAGQERGHTWPRPCSVCGEQIHSRRSWNRHAAKHQKDGGAAQVDGRRVPRDATGGARTAPPPGGPCGTTAVDLLRALVMAGAGGGAMEDDGGSDGELQDEGSGGISGDGGDEQPTDWLSRLERELPGLSAEAFLQDVVAGLFVEPCDAEEDDGDGDISMANLLQPLYDGAAVSTLQVGRRARGEGAGGPRGACVQRECLHPL